MLQYSSKHRAILKGKQSSLTINDLIKRILEWDEKYKDTSDECIKLCKNFINNIS